MKALIVYDSNFGNTRRIADHIAGQMGSGASPVAVDNFKEQDLEKIQLLIAGCPINAWRPSPKMITFLEGMKPGRLKGVQAAAFDTRVKSILSGNAAKKIAKALREAGADLIVPERGFYVKGNKGPLVEGELKKAGEWAQEIIARLNGSL